MTHNQVTYLLGKRNAEISQQNADTKVREVENEERRTDLDADIAKENIKSNRESQNVGTAIAVAAIVVSVIIACFW